MSDVTGNLGGESIRLRGMALEDTQYRIFEKIEDLLKINQKMAEKQGADLADINKGLGKAKKSIDDLGAVAGKSSGELTQFKDTLTKGVGAAFNMLIETIQATGRTIRGMDSNIDDASFSIRSMSQNFSREGQAAVRFVAESVSQLQDQYRSFKQMSDIGGVVSSQFDDLRVISAKMGVTMDQYAGLMQDNFLNLRIGGRAVHKSMTDLSVAVKGIREDEEGLPYLFSRLGINVNEYGKTVLQMTALNRGLNSESVTNTAQFNKSIKDAVITTIGLADAFGIERSKMMDAQKKAIEDVRLQTLFDNLDIPNDVKTRVLNTFLGITGNDMSKAVQLAFGQFTGLGTKAYTEYMAAGAGPLLDQTVADAQAVSKGLMTNEQYVERFGKTLTGVTQTLNNIPGVMTAMISTDPVIAAMVDLMAIRRKFSTDMSAVSNAINGTTTAMEDGGKSQIDTLKDVQLQNVIMAVTAAEANKGLNALGLTAAGAVQVITSALVSATGGVVSGATDHEYTKSLISQMNTLSKDLSKSVDMTDGAKAFGRKIIDMVEQGMTAVGAPSPRPTSSTGTNTSAVPTSSTTAGGEIMSRMVTVKTTTSGQTQRVPVGQIDEIKGQHNQGGVTSPAIKQLLGVLSGSSNLTVTGINDAYGGRGANSSHNKGLAVDFTIPGGKSAYAEKYKQVYDQLTKAYGLVPGRDFKIFDEANMPRGHTTGAHMHVEFSEQGASKFQKSFQGMFQDTQGATGPGGSTGSTSTPTPAPSSQQTSSVTPTQTGNIETTASTALASTSSSVNNSTSSMVAIADPELLAKLDSLNTQMMNVNNSVVSFGVKLEASMFG